MHRIGSVLKLSKTHDLDATANPSYVCRPQRAGVVATLTSVLCAAMLGCCQPNDPNCHNQSIGPSGAEVAAVAIGIGAVVATAVGLEVHHAHHTLNGCVSDGAGSGLQLLTSGGTKEYVLTGDTKSLKTGEHVRLHGSRVKPTKGSTATPTFQVEQETKDYGACKVKGSPPPAP